MLFNSLNFAIFLPIVFILYWFIAKRSYKTQNILLLVASYFFYASWNWKFLFLLVFSTSLDYFSGLKIAQAESKTLKRFWLLLSVCINVGFLGFFKYYNFFAKSFAEAAGNLGIHVDPWLISVILPVGISFYTFHGLSYVFDIYNDKIKPTKNFIDYSVFVSFFPLLVAGPIERATHLLPQIKRERTFDYAKAVDGLRQILWGLFKKIVIADRCATYVEMIFSHSGAYSGSTLVLGAFLFTIQIYCDFSGYSDIAIGTARLFGINLIRNFAFPYFSRDIAEFWRRWHISLDTWFRDYLYIPMGGSRVSTWKRIRNVFVIFLISGFWHGANWTFIFWGFLNALFILPLMISKRNRKYLDIPAKGRLIPHFREASAILLTFILTNFAWIFFRAKTITQSIHYVIDIFSSTLFAIPTVKVKLSLFLFIIFTIVVEWLNREKQHGLEAVGVKFPRIVKWGFYYALVFTIFYYSGSPKPFIYFQF